MRFPRLNMEEEPGAKESSANHLRAGSSRRRAWGALVEAADLQAPSVSEDKAERLPGRRGLSITCSNKENLRG